MDSLEYSTDALEVKGAFYNKKVTIYVEGIDDPIFWNEVLNLVNKNAYIEDVGGCNELEKYIRKIIEEDADFYVACDRDHSDFLDENYLDSEKILFTYGYSIENSMYKSNSINKVIVKYSKNPNLDLKEEIDNILLDFESKVNELLIYDIASKKYKKGISVFGDNCSRFLRNKSSKELCENKLNEFIASINTNFSNEEINSVRILVDNAKKSKWFHIKGHFISLLIINIIKHYTKKFRGKDISLTIDDLYSHTIDSMKDNIHDSDIIFLIGQTNKINYA